MATPIIAIIPSAYKEGVLAAVLPNNGIADLDFTRGSTATRINAQGLIEEVGVNIPRLDYSDGNCPSLLLEPQSTNLVTYSEDFSNSSWVAFDVTKVPDSIIDPGGTLTGCRVTGLAGSNKVLQQITSVTADPNNQRTYTGSIWVKSPNSTTTQLRVGGTTGTSNKVITISQEWKRFDHQYILQPNSTFIRLGIICNNEGDIIDVAFGQTEQQSYATYYIPNSGTTEGITRLEDSASLDLTPFNITSIIETIDGVEQPPITTIPTIYNAPIGRVNKILMY